MEIVVNPLHRALSDFISNIPMTFEEIPDVIQNHRNDIRICTVNGEHIVIKCFKGMYIPNQIAYSLFRKSKAQRSYQVSLILINKGFNVPEPIGYVDCYRYGFLTQSYFVSKYYEHVSLDASLRDKSNRYNVLNSLVDFTHALHRADVYHYDYSNGNILCNRDGDRMVFALVDLNRVLFKSVTYMQGLRNFAKLAMPNEDLEILINRYATAHGRSGGEGYAYILNLRNRQGITNSWRKRLKTIFFPWRTRLPIANKQTTRV